MDTPLHPGAARVCLSSHALLKIGHHFRFPILGFFKFYFIGVSWLYNVVLLSSVQQSESAVHIDISPLFWISLPFRPFNCILIIISQASIV